MATTRFARRTWASANRGAARLALATALFLAACTQGVDGTVERRVTIAFVGRLSLPGAAAAFDGVRLAVRQALEEGGLPVPVEVVAFDVAGTGLEEVVSEVASDGGVVAAVLSPVGPAPADALREEGLPLLDLSGLARGQTRALGEFAEALPRAADGICARGRVGSLPGRVRISSRPRRAVAVVAKSGCRVIEWRGPPEAAGALRAGLVRSGLGDVIVVGTDGLLSAAFVSSAGRAAEGTVVACPCTEFATSKEPAAQAFVNGFQSEVGRVPSAYAVEGWDAGVVLAGALSATPSREDVKENLGSVSAFEGLGGGYRLEADGRIRTLEGVRFYRASGGRWTLLGTVAGPGFSLRREGVLTVASCRSGVRSADGAGGFDVSVSRMVAGRVGLDLAWRVLVCDRIPAALAAGTIDVAAATSRVPMLEGATQSPPYLSVHQALTVNLRASVAITATEQLGPSDVVAAVRGSAALRWVREALAPLGVRARVYARAADAFAALLALRVDAVVHPEGRSHAVARRNRSLRVVDSVDVGTYDRLAVSLRNPALAVAIDDALDDVLSSTRFARLFSRSFPGAGFPRELRAA